ncbi:hypothetical protein PR001_g15159 [Phytophthora rubi]|uniref:Secreted protein n=1 Tax=Phytophthora rubi TaxID=129364 RepID=A0A6A3L982_9STRA|nr:hypothetical protein PR001_g15159 [Phytophthora rubi]KAE9028483.1 hypothetical protein PR002_g10385 [Phytophthora rubi]
MDFLVDLCIVLFNSMMTVCLRAGEFRATHRNSTGILGCYPVHPRFCWSRSPPGAWPLKSTLYNQPQSFPIRSFLARTCRYESASGVQWKYSGASQNTCPNVT